MNVEPIFQGCTRSASSVLETDPLLSNNNQEYKKLCGSGRTALIVEVSRISPASKQTD